MTRTPMLPVFQPKVCSPPWVARIWGISYSTLPRDIFYLLKGDYRV